MSNSEISAIIPLYNAEKTIALTIESVLSQTFSNWELILVNDGSSDGSENVCLQYQKRDSRIIYKKIKNSGVSTARNVGLEVASGKYITFLDADDTYEKEMMSTTVEMANLHGAEIVQFAFQTVKNDIVEQKIIHNLPLNRILSADEMLRFVFAAYISSNFRGISSVCLKIYSKDFIIRNNLKFNSKYVKAEDWLFNLIAFQHATKVVATDKIFYNYIKQNEMSITSSYRRVDVARMEISFGYLENLNKKYNINGDIYKNYLRNSILLMFKIFKNENFNTASYLTNKISKKKYFRKSLKNRNRLPSFLNIIALLLQIKLNTVANALLYIGAKFLK